MTGDRIDECKGGIERIFKEIVPLSHEIDRLATGTNIPANNMAEAKQLATKILQLNKDVNGGAKNAYRFALEMDKLLAPDDRRAPVIKKIVEIAKNSLLEVSNKALKLAEKANEVVSKIPPDANQTMAMMMLLPLVEMNNTSNVLQTKRDLLFKQYEELSPMYDRFSSSDTMDVLELLESEIHARKSTIIGLGKKCDETVWSAEDISMNFAGVVEKASRVVKLNEEAHPIAEKSREYALWMQSLVIPNDPRAVVITKIVEATENALQLSTEALELARRAAGAARRASLSGNDPMTAILNNQQLVTEMRDKSNELVVRRNRLDKEYEQLSLAFRTGTPLEEAKGGEEEIPLD